MAGEFTDEGTETHFAIGSQPAYVRAVSSGNKRSGILHPSFVVHNDDHDLGHRHDNRHHHHHHQGRGSFTALLSIMMIMTMTIVMIIVIIIIKVGDPSQPRCPRHRGAGVRGVSPSSVVFIARVRLTMCLQSLW